jgi:hypothetical protein
MQELDPITVEVLWTRLISVIDEAGLTLHRTSFSTVVRESHDYTCMVLAPDGQAVAQATRSIPSFIGTLPMSVKAFLKKYPAETLRPGDVVISNDPWIGTGHLPDITLAAPIFHEERLVGFAGAIAHMGDIGGRRRAPDSRDIYEEGLQIPILKLYEAGEANRTLFNFIRENVRTPDEVTGDIHAMVGACEKMRAGVTDLLAEYAMPDLEELAARIIELTRSAMSRAISKIPDGGYRTVTPIDSFDNSRPLEIHCELRVRGDRIVVDFAGSSPQNPSPLNYYDHCTRRVFSQSQLSGGSRSQGKCGALLHQRYLQHAGRGDSGESAGRKWYSDSRLHNVRDRSGSTVFDDILLHRRAGREARSGRSLDTELSDECVDHTRRSPGAFISRAHPRKVTDTRLRRSGQVPRWARRTCGPRSRQQSSGQYRRALATPEIPSTWQARWRRRQARTHLAQ